MAELFAIDEHKSTKPPLPDAAERERALDIHHSWIVEAPAGSGKTGLLIQRYLRLLADESVTSPEQILAITFTRKATAEMRERVLSQLQNATSESEPANDFDRETRPMALAALERDRKLNWSLVDQPNRLRIRTIDSVCSEIANSLPVLSGTGGRRDVVDEAGELYAIAAHRTFLQLGGSDVPLNKALREVLLHRDGDLANCERLLASMLRLRDQWGALVPLGRRELDDTYLDTHVLPKLERALDNAICTALTQVTRHFPEHLLRQLTLAATSMAHIAGYKGATSPIAICANRNLSPGERAEDLDHWRALIHLLLTKEKTLRKAVSANIVKFELSKSEQANLKALIAEFHDRDDLLAALCKLDELPPAKYPQEQWLIAKHLFRVLNHAMAELQIVFAERSECDHAEIALAAKTALSADTGPDDLEAALGLRLQHILVDEMQDTSSSQYELIQMLTAHFDGHSQTAFLVGDPKQSIYLFRQARVERFLHAMSTEQLGDVHLGLLRLTANFRSQAGLVGDFNDDFSQIFSSPTAQTHSGEVQFVAASAMRPRDEDSGDRVWHADVLPYVKPGEASSEQKKHRQASALEIREIIEYWRASPLPEDRQKPWQIAVLVRSRSHLERIVATFKEVPAIPYRAVDIDPLKERPEVMDLFALTRALLHPADRTAWLAVLHAPWCGFDLSELHTLTGADDPAFSDWTMHALIAERGDLLPPEAITRLERIWPVFAAAAAQRHRAPFAQTVERTWRSLGGDAYLDGSELANAHSYLRLLEDLEEQQGSVAIAALEARLERLFAAPSLDPTAVELLTIHKAKGLEWDVVIVPALERTSGRNHSEFLSWVELDSSASTSDQDEAAHFILAPIAGRGEDSAELNKWIAGIHKSRESAETRRLFYVACTRAREELHLFAAPKLSAKGEINPAAGTLLKAAWPAAEAAFAGPLASAQSPSNVTEFPPPIPEGILEDIAASTSVTDQAQSKRPAILKRLPIIFDPATRLANPRPLPYGDTDEAPSLHFERPEGSVAARAFGNAVHAFLELLTQQIATGESAANLLHALPGWTPRVAAILRSEGLPPTMVERLTQRVLHALASTLKDPTGLWLLSPHQGSATEFALTAWATQRSNIRIDRVFRAGADPLAAGSDHLWIVDYKTTTHGPEGLDAFLAEEREKYAPQLEAYAAILKQKEDETVIRLALYYPMLSKLNWWIP
ncbi:ATP-dependent exoDNAse (exonuclease V) beta subunit [Granulicella aggregans]|uniref:DNA 3'-5' helicase n=1 Tax=Granulicella aggregans TaxID=474949 RepID=A0A7W7Z8R9_9BACT|nr:UvrD-helicase domain-containing protein [Granulicella aggregans]MBB5055373.1 ATP-dependent exoDNAse (exonuclease V) beta subunit [Granulicella aggregans]